MAYDFDLGAHSRAVSDIPEAQAWFDRGLIWTYGYNHEEAIVCFEHALKADPTLALAHWGIAYAIGPNYNKPWEVFTDDEKAPCLSRAHAEIDKALGLSDLDDLDRRLLETLRLRYPTDPTIRDYQSFHDAFAKAMGELHIAFPDDLDFTCFAAEALMNRTPWNLWNLATGKANPEGSAKQAKAILDTAFERPEAWKHPGLLHMYIHLMEQSPTPEAALRHGDALTGLCPDSGHLMHMATHIDVLCGEFANVVRRNHEAWKVDEKFKAYAGGANFYALYRIHNLHFETYGAMFLAQPTVALNAADRLRGEVPDDVVRVYPDLFEAFVATKPHVLVRFGMWQDILNEPIPEDAELYTFTRALMRYARAVAFANLGRHEDAAREAATFENAFAEIPETRKLFQNYARDVLAVAAEMMRGEVAYKSGNTAKGLDHLRNAVELDDGLMYEEPWAWPQPTRHALGALLMDAQEYEEAENVYRADLGLDPTLPRALQNPGNIWALHGLHECLTMRGETVERPHIERQLSLASARAEVPIRASCYCRKAG